MDIGKRIRTLRDYQGLSMNELARRSGVSQSGLSLIESGQRQPTFDVIERICTGLGITLQDLLNEDATTNVMASDLHNFLNKTKELKPSQFLAIRHILSTTESIVDKFSLINQQLDRLTLELNISDKTKPSFVEIIDLLDNNKNVTLGGKPLTLDERIEILEFLKNLLPDEEQIAVQDHNTKEVIAASYQGEGLVHIPTPEQAEDIRKAIEFAEQQHKKDRQKE
ncbi:helix-turn-helix domain-containing protein [Desulforamulus aquiferis]|uniref:Helix-turn-helix transcriptional regulator n=1 Tax=Desulforamulus aquiferis TaxID=1397668 RepID=A0AAW7Z8Z2_9FIRM|nr:helix-turn-helix transcriptional regulator [Desulforamulus aquiferis]MDO7785827.1 helix-turn-helix transcriptional regulator [Desulforamulus aquiferis]